MTTYLFDRDGILRTVLSADEVVDLIHDEGSYSLDAVFAGTVEVEPGEYIGFACADGRFRMFCVEDRAYRDDKKTCEVSATDRAVVELSESIIEDQQLLDVTLTQALEALLPDGWEVAGADPGTAEKCRAYFTSAWTMCQTLEELYSWRIIPYYVFSGGKITGKRVDLADSTPTWRGRVLKSNSDAENVMVTTSGRPITRLYGIGPATNSGDVQTNMTFEDVVWSIADGDPANKPAGQCWVEDVTAKGKYGLHTAVVSITDLTGDTDAEKQDDLLKKTWEQLQTLKRPTVRADANLVDLELLPGGEDLPPIRLGDLVGVRLDNGDWVEAKVVSVKRNYARPWLGKITIGDKADTITNQVTGLIASATHTFERLTVYQNRFREDEALIQLNAEYVQANADRIDLFAGEMSETSIRIDGVEDTISAQAKEIALKADKTTVDSLETTVNSQKTTINSLITEINGKVSVDDLSANVIEIIEAANIYKLTATTLNAYEINVGAGVKATHVDAEAVYVGEDSVVLGKLTMGDVITADIWGDEVNLSHSHKVTVNADGTITLGEVATTGGTFKIADTAYYKDGVSAARKEGKNDYISGLAVWGLSGSDAQFTVCAGSGTSRYADKSQSGELTLIAASKLVKASINGVQVGTIDCQAVYDAGYSAGYAAATKDVKWGSNGQDTGSLYAVFGDGAKTYLGEVTAEAGLTVTATTATAHAHARAAGVRLAYATTSKEL